MIEVSLSPPPGSIVQLVRGPLIVHGLVVWCEDGRCGLKFSGGIDIAQWRAPIGNAEQQRIDDILYLLKSGGDAVEMSDAPAEDAPSRTVEQRLAHDLRQVSDLLAQLGDRLAKDGIVVAQYGTELQTLDIAVQAMAAVEGILGGESDFSTEWSRLDGIRRSVEQALKRPINQA